MYVYRAVNAAAKVYVNFIWDRMTTGGGIATVTLKSFLNNRKE